MRFKNSKSCQLRMNVAPATPIPANANPTSSADGSASNAHHEWTRPSAATVVRNVIPYNNPRKSAHDVSPTATSTGPIGVDSTASYSFMYFIFQKTLVPSYTAPFIAAVASSAGAMKLAYEISSPLGPGTFPTKWP